MRTNPGAALTRRHFLGAAAGGLAGRALPAAPEQREVTDQALVAITFDLEMSRNFPTWDQTHWDYEKGNLNEETKRYTVEACRRVRARGGVLHCFLLGQTLEQENVDWLRGIIRAGHPVGNHTYDHVNVLARRPEDIQFRFRRAPWLISGQTPRQVITENIRLTTAAMRARLGIAPVGFRTPGGFANGLADRPDLRQLLQDQGFSWVSSKYPARPMGAPGQEPSDAMLNAIVHCQAAAQPFVYPHGLVEVPMSPVSDIDAFRNGRWRLEWFLRAVRRAVEWTIEQRAVFDFLGHPSCLYITDPEFRVVDLICHLVRQAGRRAALVDLNAVAQRATRRHRPSAGQC
jgi:hypothetical protein